MSEKLWSVKWRGLECEGAEWRVEAKDASSAGASKLMKPGRMKERDRNELEEYKGRVNAN